MLVSYFNSNSPSSSMMIVLIRAHHSNMILINAHCDVKGTGNVLKIQQLLHVCSEYHGAKEEEGGGEEGTDSDAKEGGKSSSTEAAGKDGATGGDTKSKAKKTDKKSKDVEMKDAEASEPGSLFEPGAYQAVAVLGIALIAMGEDIGAEMSLRTFNHLVNI